jgi:hypothetical protein
MYVKDSVGQALTACYTGCYQAQNIIGCLQGEWQNGVSDVGCRVLAIEVVDLIGTKVS